MGPLLVVDGLTVEYDIGETVVRVVSGVSFEIAHGERLGLVGESGAGKSVVGRAVMGLIERPGRIAAGKIVFDGTELLGASEQVLGEVRGGRIALIPQDASMALNPVLRIGVQMREMIRRHLKVAAGEANARARSSLRRVGLADPDRVLNSFTHELSGGMKQRVAIAMALSCDPQLLIADDPTSAVDVTIQAQILKEFRQLTDTLGVAVLFITHDLRVVSTMCERVVVLYAGQVAEIGPSNEILDRPTHPYTHALLACSPKVEQRARPLPIVPGAPPDLHEFIPGCRFHPRCGRRLDRCPIDEPNLVGNGHKVACWNPIP